MTAVPATAADHPLTGALLAAVPLAAADLTRLAWPEVDRIARHGGPLVAQHGDELLYGGSHCTEVFAALARALAALSFMPGGIRFAGAHWQHRHPDLTDQGEQRQVEDVAIKDSLL